MSSKSVIRFLVAAPSEVFQGKPPYTGQALAGEPVVPSPGLDPWFVSVDGKRMVGACTFAYLAPETIDAAANSLAEFYPGLPAKWIRDLVLGCCRVSANKKVEGTWVAAVSGERAQLRNPVDPGNPITVATFSPD